MSWSSLHVISVHSLLICTSNMGKVSSSHPSLIPTSVRWPLVIIKSVFCLVYYWVSLFAVFSCWFNDLQIESNEGRMTGLVSKNFSNGFRIFLLSEVMIFLSLIWGFVHLSLILNIWVIMRFPSRGVVVISAIGIPFGNVLVLIKSSLPLQATIIWMNKGCKSR